MLAKNAFEWYNTDMDTQQKTKGSHKTLKDAAIYLKRLIPANIPKSYTLKPVIKKISSEENIRKGVLAYRDFLYLFCDRLIADADLYDKPPKNPNAHLSLEVRFPLLCDVNNILFKIGYHGKFTDNYDSLILRDLLLLSDPAFAEGGCGKAKLSIARVTETLEFLRSCGLNFDVIELDKQKPLLNKFAKIEVTYPDNPAVLTGIKVMAIAQKEFRIKNNHEIFQWCDYRVLMTEEPDVDSRLNDFAHPLPVKVRDFILKLHKHFIKIGLICKQSFCGIELGFLYFNKKNEVCSFFASPVSGYRIRIRAQNTEKYSDTIKKFPLFLQEKIARGYGCDPKKFGEPCQNGCHGFSFSLDDSVLKLTDDIKIWIDEEVVCLN